MAKIMVATLTFYKPPNWEIIVLTYYNNTISVGIAITQADLVASPTASVKKLKSVIYHDTLCGPDILASSWKP